MKSRHQDSTVHLLFGEQKYEITVSRLALLTTPGLLQTLVEDFKDETFCLYPGKTLTQDEMDSLDVAFDVILNVFWDECSPDSMVCALSHLVYLNISEDFEQFDAFLYSLLARRKELSEEQLASVWRLLSDKSWKERFDPKNFGKDYK